VEVPRVGEDAEVFVDFGVARWRLCFTAPIPGSAEGLGECRWSPDRQSVDLIYGGPVRVGAIEYGSRFIISEREFALEISDQVERWTAEYQPTADPPTGAATEDGRAGGLAFDVSLAWDYEDSPPARLPPRHVGSMRWICGDPPPPA
jgi:hypothetical protein